MDGQAWRDRWEDIFRYGWVKTYRSNRVCEGSIRVAVHDRIWHDEVYVERLLLRRSATTLLCKVIT